MSWRDIQLGDAFSIKHGFAFRSEYFTDAGEYVVLTPGNFYEPGGFRPRPGKDRYYSQRPPDDFVLGAGDLIIAMTEQGAGLLGSAALIPEEGYYLHNQRIGLIENLDSTMLDRGFLYRLFNSQTLRAPIRATASGTKVRHTAPKRIYKITVRVPTTEQQRRISEVLSEYDRLIENNRRRIALLEESARLLYREWFVHLRFPGHEHVEFIDGVPKDWKRCVFEEVCEVVGGGTPSTHKPEFWSNGDITWYTPTDITRNSCLALLDSATKISEAGLSGSSAKILPSGTVLMTSRASVGFFGITDRPSCTNQGFISIIPNDLQSRLYLLHNLMSRVEEIRANAGGATYKEISKGKFKALPVLMPPRWLAQRFEAEVATLYEQVRNLHAMNQSLAKARDLLLPRLISGQITV